jgi:hypothetical protein
LKFLCWRFHALSIFDVILIPPHQRLPDKTQVMIVGAVLECNAHKARVQTGDGGELNIKRANPKLYSSGFVEIYGTIQPDSSIMEVTLNSDAAFLP